MINFHIITIFPDQISLFAKEGLLRIAQREKAISIIVHDLRKWGIGKHKRVDDRPYGGGAGMVLMPEPVFKAVEEIKSGLEGRTEVIAMMPSGKKFTQSSALKFAQQDPINYILLCGHYEGFDQRIIEKLVDRKISIGDYVLSGGELPALVVVDAVSRLLPGVLGNEKSLEFETHNQVHDKRSDYPNWTRPEQFRGMRVPDVLLTGDHAKIKSFREDSRKKVLGDS